MDKVLPERVLVEETDDHVTYRISAAYTDGGIGRFGPGWEQVQAEEPYLSTWTNGFDTICYCEGDITLETRR